MLPQLNYFGNNKPYAVTCYHMLTILCVFVCLVNKKNQCYMLPLVNNLMCICQECQEPHKI